MNRINFHRNQSLELVALMFVAAGFGSLLACSQSEPTCVIAPTIYYAKLEATKQSGTCEPLTRGRIATAYHLGETKPNGDTKTAGMSLALLEARETFAGVNLEDNGEVTSPYDGSFAKFSSAYPNAKGVCQTEKLTPTIYEWDGLPAQAKDDPETERDETEELAAGALEINWSDLRVTVTTATPGSYFEGKYTIEEECGEITYSFAAIPETACDVDGDCDILGASLKLWCNPDLTITEWKREGFVGTCDWSD